MTISHHVPLFESKASCESHDPELWFPQEESSVAPTRTESAMKARAICAECPALMECRSYALQYSELSGIWGGKDLFERKQLQIHLGITPIRLVETYDFNGFAHFIRRTP